MDILAVVEPASALGRLVEKFSDTMVIVPLPELFAVKMVTPSRFVFIIFVP
jgi:hypothetical protein